MSIRATFCISSVFFHFCASTGFVKSQGLSAFAANSFPQKKQRQLETVKMRMKDNDKALACSSGLLDCSFGVEAVCKKLVSC